jgi:hypothetical protein
VANSKLCIHANRHVARVERFEGGPVAHPSRRHRRLIQSTAVRLPSIRTDTRADAAPIRARFGRAPVQRRMCAVTVIVPLEIEELYLEISGRPEEGAVHTFALNRANQPFNEGMREWRVRHRLDFFHVEDSQIRLPLVEPIQGIMVRADVCRRGLASSRSIEHPAQPEAIHVAAMHAKADDATCALIHHYENPMRAEHGRFATKQVETPQSVLRMTEDGEPRRPRRVGRYRTARIRRTTSLLMGIPKAKAIC